MFYSDLDKMKRNGIIYNEIWKIYLINGMIYNKIWKTTLEI